MANSIKKPVKRPVGRDEIAAQIRADIMDGTLSFGQRFSENIYAEQFNVSRTPVREAILSLASLGLLTIKPRSGTFVTRFSEASLQQLFEVRQLFEIGGVRFASGTQRLRLVARLEKLFQSMDASISSEQRFDNFSALDTEFHTSLVAASGNAQLIQMYTPVEACVQAARSRLETSPAILSTAQDHHAAIVRTIREGDIPNFERILGDHLAWVLGMLLRVDELFDRMSDG